MPPVQADAAAGGVVLLAEERRTRHAVGKPLQRVLQSAGWRRKPALRESESAAPRLVRT